MTKVLFENGPYFWVREPHTEFEARMLAHDYAEGARKRIEQHGPHPVASGRELDEKALAGAPVPPVTEAELERWRAEYPDDFWISPTLPAPNHLMTPAQEREHFWKPLEGMTHITFYGGAPHRPKSPAQ